MDAGVTGTSIDYCALRLLRWSVLEILMYHFVHSGFCAPSASY